MLSDFDRKNQSEFSNDRTIAYVLSDGFFDLNIFGDIDYTKEFVVDEIRAVSPFGGGNLSNLNTIDSDKSETIRNAQDLVDSFYRLGEVELSTIEQINVKLEDRVIDEIHPDELTSNDSFNWTFEGTIEDLEVSPTAENNISFEIIYQDNVGISTTIADYKVRQGKKNLLFKTMAERKKPLFLVSIKLILFLHLQSQLAMASSVNKLLVMM